MTLQTGEALDLTAVSGRKWSLAPVRPLSPSVQLTRHASAHYALKTLTLRSEEHIQAAVADAAVWRRACAADSTNIVLLHDVAVHPPHVYYIMEYCPGGSIDSVRNERAALRCIAAVASGLEVVLSVSDEPAHANLSSTHVLLDASASPKLAGWGVTRARRLANSKRRFSERDDVRALTAILYEMIYGKRCDPDSLKLPETPKVSPLTGAMLREILFGRLKDVPELTVFRYDIAAARQLVPACTPALAPIVNRRREEFLDVDLDSKRGLDPADARRAEKAAPDHSPVRDQQVGKPALPEKMAAPVRLKPVEHEPKVSDPMNPVALDLSNDAAVDDIVRRVTTGDLSAMNADELEAIVESCAQMDDLPDKIFKVFFRLPISKNPLVAFKAITVIHRLMAHGPAKLTALAITNDGFLSWIESSWSRERIQNKTGKVHMYAYCFAAGEVSWYTTVLRKRIEVHGKFAQVFSTHWVTRPDGMAYLRTTRRDAFRLVLDVVEKCSTILRKVVMAKDPAASVKQSAAPMLTAEVSKAYLAICWLYATAENDLKRDLESELEVAHNAAKSAIDAVCSVPEIASLCAPESLLELDTAVPRQFDVAALAAALKKKKRKKKKKPAAGETTEAQNKLNGKNSADEVHDERDVAEEEKGGEESDDVAVPIVTEIEPRKRMGSSKRGKPKKRSDEEPDKPSSANVSNGGSDLQDVPAAREHFATAPSRDSVEVSGLQKLSLSVRRGVSRSPPSGRPPAFGRRASSEDDTSLRRGDSAQTGSDPGRGRSRERRRSSEEEEDSSDSENEDRNVHPQVNVSKPPLAPRRKGKKKTVSSAKDVRVQSDSEEEEEPSRRKKANVKKKKKKKNIKKASDSEGTDSDDQEAESEGSSRKKGTRKHVDEKSIPFDKEHPTKRKASKKKSGDEEYSGGSKEALAAAAKGKKTPSMNPQFEVAPYEVHFGPQIGSGGFGVVYKAKFRNETVAVKKIHGHALSNAASVAEFQSEVAVLCTLRHPHILRFVGACTKPPNLMIITEFMARGTLFDVLHQSNMRVTWPMRKKFALDTCKGMRYLHDSKLLHRDLKSSNLMLDKDFNCKVGDFGLTRISRGTAAVQMTGQCGTFQYMAVEVLANKPYSEKADVFSFGILLWEMVARKLPYFGMQPMQVGIAVLQQGLRPTIPPKCPDPLAKLMRACWDSDPNRRPSFAQLVDALEAMPE